MKRIFKQVIFDMRHSPLIASVTIVGTALAVFLVLISLTIERAGWVDFAPESRRSTMLHAKSIHIESAKSGFGLMMSGGMSYATANTLFADLPSAELCTIYGSSNPLEVSVAGGSIYQADTRLTDANFWKVFDFTFVHGSPYSDDNHAQPQAVINAEIARRLFKTTDVVGRQIIINHSAYVICGVVEPVSTLAGNAYAQVWTAIPADKRTLAITSVNDVTGGFRATLLAPDASHLEAIYNEAQGHYAMLDNTLMAMDSITVHSHKQPLDSRQMSQYVGGNIDPTEPKTNWLLYAILLLVPAINMIGAIQGRLRNRISEIGLKRSMGATKVAITCELLAESFITTLAGGIIGSVLAVVFAYFFADAVFAKTDFWGGAQLSAVNAPISLLIGWGTVALVVAICFVLNLLSAGIPAWLASRVTPAAALSGNRR